MAIRTRAGSPTVWLDVTYQGLDAPIDFFADLELIGWTPPTLAPPPHNAIDWSRPNEATGERFTLRDYTIAGAVAHPPTGTGSRGAWTEAERASHLASLTRVLGRHGTVEVDDPAGLVRPAPPAALPPPPPVASPVAASAPPTTATAVLITAPIKPSLGPRVEDALVALGVTAVFDSQERLQEQRYRGSTCTTTVTQLHVAAVVAAHQLDVVVETLRDLGLILTFADVADGAVSPEPADDDDGAPSVRTSAEPTAAPPAPDRLVGLARVVALAHPRSVEAVDEVIRTLGLTDTSVARSTRTEVSTYRGSVSERDVPALRVEVWVPEAHALLVANHLAEATHLRLSDTARIWIDPPPPGAPAAPAAPIAATPSVVAPTDAAPPPPPVPAPGHAPSELSTGTARLDSGELTRRVAAPEFVDHGR